MRRPSDKQLSDPQWWADNVLDGVDYAFTYHGAVEFANVYGEINESLTLAIDGGFWELLATRPGVKSTDNSIKNKYSTPVGDVYDVLKAFEVTNPALQHLIKKALKVGKRGHKDLETDLQDIIDSANRAKQLEGY